MEGKDDTRLKYKIIRLLGLKIIDIYVIRTFLSTFLLSILLILVMVAIIDTLSKWVRLRLIGKREL